MTDQSIMSHQALYNSSQQSRADAFARMLKGLARPRVALSILAAGLIAVGSTITATAYYHSNNYIERTSREYVELELSQISRDLDQHAYAKSRAIINEFFADAKSRTRQLATMIVTTPKADKPSAEEQLNQWVHDAIRTHLFAKKDVMDAAKYAVENYIAAVQEEANQFAIRTKLDFGLDTSRIHSLQSDSIRGRYDALLNTSSQLNQADYQARIGRGITVFGAGLAAGMLAEKGFHSVFGKSGAKRGFIVVIVSLIVGGLVDYFMSDWLEERAINRMTAEFDKSLETMRLTILESIIAPLETERKMLVELWAANLPTHLQQHRIQNRPEIVNQLKKMGVSF